MLVLSKIYENDMPTPDVNSGKKIPIEDLKNTVKEFILKNHYPKDKAIHNLAAKLGIEPDELETATYALLTDVLTNIPGKHRDVDVSKFDPKQIKMGIGVEKEHTDCPKIAVEIAKDHLAEIPDYYTRLKKMEDEAKGKRG